MYKGISHLSVDIMILNKVISMIKKDYGIDKVSFNVLQYIYIFSKKKNYVTKHCYPFANFLLLVHYLKKDGYVISKLGKSARYSLTPLGLSVIQAYERYYHQELTKLLRSVEEFNKSDL